MNAVEIAVAVVVGLLAIVAVYAAAQQLHWHFVGRARWEARVAAEEAAQWEQIQREIAEAQRKREIEKERQEKQRAYEHKTLVRKLEKAKRIKELKSEYEAVCGWYIGRVVYDTDRQRQEYTLRDILRQIEEVERGY